MALSQSWSAKLIILMKMIMWTIMVVVMNVGVEGQNFVGITPECDLSISGSNVHVRKTADAVAVVEPTEEFRSLFVATVDNIDWPLSSSDPPTVQQAELIGYLDMMQSTHMNAVMFQVRTSGDALYASDIEPWSKYLTGTQGVAPSPAWDPLRLLVEEAHRRGIEVHAWLNPYRANMAPNWDGLTPNHMAVVYRQYAYPYDTYLWMDPGADDVINRLLTVVQDIVTRYDVDGIHFDDYFYPYPDAVGSPFPDDATYRAYLDANGTLSHDDWRRDNVNKMIEQVYTLVKSLRPGVQFSLSPFGLYRPGDPNGMPPPIAGFDPYTEIYADALLWLQSGWVDFMAPQLYWNINATGQSYPMLLDWWLQNNLAHRNIYAANGVYKIEAPSSWPIAEIEAQIEISRDPTRRDLRSLGNILFSAKYFRDNTSGIRDAFAERVYTLNATSPPLM
jgi:uncharacterized lipoprotein YddW (UPF0748 family)